MHTLEQIVENMMIYQKPMELTQFTWLRKIGDCSDVVRISSVSVCVSYVARNG